MKHAHRLVALGLVLVLGACKNPSSPAKDPTKGPSVSLAGQSGTIAGGTPGSAYFAATTEEVAEATVGAISWYASPAGTSAASAPSGVTASVTPVAEDAATVTMSADETAAEGSYYFKLKEGEAVSAVATLTIAPPLTPVVDLGSQTGELVGGAPGSASFAAATANIAAGAVGTISWYSDAAGSTPASAPTGVAPSVSAVSGNAATVTMTTDETAVGGSYYFTLAEGSAVSAVATLTILAPTASLGNQSGILRGGTAGSASFAATTEHVAAGTVGTISWYASPAGTSAASAPAGVAASVSAVSGDAATVTMAADATAAVGAYYFKLAEGQAVSGVATLTIIPPLLPVVDLGTQTGELVGGTAGSATFSAATANVAAGTAGTVSWFADPAGASAASAPAGVTASVSAVAGDAATVTISVDASALGGSYYFKLAEGSAVSAVATLTILTPAASLGTQSGTPRNGRAGSASFAATTAHVAAGAVGTISWYADQAGATAASAPAGVSATVSAVSGNAATVTMTVAASASIGSYYFRLAEGPAVSNLATLNVYPAYALYAANLSSDNLSAYSMDANTGALGALPGSPYATGDYPFSLTVDPAGTFVYVVNLSANSVSAFSIDPLTGGLAAIPGSPFAVAASPRSIHFDPTGRFAYVPAGYSAVYAYSVDPSTGAIGAQVPGSPFAASTGFDRLVLSPDGKFAFATNCLAVSISAFSVNAATGALAAVSGSPFAAGNYYPTALAIDRSGKYLYAGEDYSSGSGKLCAYAIDAAGALSPVAGAPFDSGVASRALAVDPAGRRLYVSAQTGGSDYGIYVYSIEAATGALAQIAGSPFSALYSEGMLVDPRGKFLYRSSQSNGVLSAYSIDAATGALAEIAGSPFAAGSGPRGIGLVELP